MPASTYVSSAGEIRLYDGSVQTFDKLPVATYSIHFNPMTGYSLRLADPLMAGEETIYGNHESRVRRILNSYSVMDRSLGAICSGDKGMGKSLLLRMLAEKARDELGLPTILVRDSFPGLASFLDQIGESVIVFDEFEKVFSGDEDASDQTQFLGLFDGLSTTKRMYVLSVNKLERTSDFMLNRPGRFHYHMRFDYPDEKAIRQYLEDQAPDASTSDVNKVIDFAQRFDVNFDHLRSIAFELRTGDEFDSFIGDLNIKRSTGRYKDLVNVRVNWLDGDFDEVQSRIDLFDQENTQSFSEWDLFLDAKFRLRDATPSPEGFVLTPGVMDVHDTRDLEDDDDDDRAKLLKSIVISRARQASIDF